MYAFFSGGWFDFKIHESPIDVKRMEMRSRQEKGHQEKEIE